MSADRPYQSHLFNSLNRNVQRAKDRAGLLWRNWVINVKVAVLWGAQMASYPVNAVLNASRQVSKQVGQISKQVNCPMVLICWLTRSPTCLLICPTCLLT